MKRKNMKVDMGSEKKTRKIRLDTVRDFVKSFGYDILSKNYSGPRTKMEFKCPEKHTFRMAYSDFKQGKRCPVCALDNKKDLKKFTIDKVQELFSREGYILFSKEYDSSQENLEVSCPEGHDNHISLYEFKKGVRCKECVKPAKTQEIDQDKVRNYISNQNYMLITKKVVNLDSKIVMKCDGGHRVLMSYNNFKSGKRCQECVNEHDTAEIIKAREILKDVTGCEFNREVVENNKAVKMGVVRYDGYSSALKLIFDISETRDLNKLVFCRLNGIMYLRISKNEINKEDIKQKLIDLGIMAEF
jgi:hypothetical protein